MVDPYKFSGSLSAKDSTYVERDADRDLYDALIAGEFCYVLESRQTGKSSLRNRIMEKFQAPNVNIKYVAYNITKGSVQQAILSDWYQDQISRIISDFKINYSLNLGINLKEWWEDTPGSPLGKYEKFIEDVLLAQTGDDKIVIFIDEIDSVLDFPFPTDDFFAFIRACYEERNNKPMYKRLTFCILGVASPNNLIKDKRRTPFNIGKAITLKPLPVDMNDPKSFDKIEPLIKGLEGKFNDSKQIMQQILDSTGGQPFLTQKLCQLMVEESKKENPNPVDQVVKSRIIDNWEFQDEPDHLRTIRDRILMNEKWAFDLLKMYRDILSYGQIDANSSFNQIELKLTGLVLQDGSLLKAYNPIYREIFNLNWVEVQLGKLRLYIEEFNNWNKADYRNKQLYLLYGDKFEQAWQWKEGLQQQGGDITGREQTFLIDSQQFWVKVRNAFPYECNYQAIIQAMNDCTGGFEDFNKIIFEIARSEDREPPAMGTEKDWMGDLVTSNLNRFCQPDSIEKQFMDDNDPNIDRFRLICTYQEILQNEAVTFDESPEHKKLAGMCLIIKNQEDNKLRILNKIYEYIFNQELVNKMLDYICPYTKEFQAWQASGCQDKSLLCEDLQKAIDWIQNKDKLSESELEFIITSLVWEMWQSDDAVNKVKEFLPQVQKKTQTPAHLVRVIQAILAGTRPQLVLLQDVLQWVGDAEFIPTEDEAKWLKGVVRSHLKNCNAQKLAEYLDFNDPSNACWRELQIKHSDCFIVIDREILDEYSKFRYSLIVSEFPNLQQIVSNYLSRIFDKEIKKMKQDKLDELLSSIVAKGSAIEAIAIVNLEEGTLEYHNKELETSKPEIYQALFGNRDVSDALADFSDLKGIPVALKTFGNATKYGELEYSMFYLNKGIVIVDFLDLPQLTVAICFIATSEANFAKLVRQYRDTISPIKEELESALG